MKLLQNKETGEIGCLECLFGKTPEKITVVEYIDGRRGSRVWYYDSLTKLIEEWEDYGLPNKIEGIWLCYENIMIKCYNDTFRNEIFDKLKAFMRLKDKGFEFKGWKNDARVGFPRINWSIKEIDKQVDKDLDLLFGGEK